MIKAISTVIASILMLMIVIALGGTAYLYISGTLTGKTATTFEIIDEVNGTVIIRNSGTETITRMTATLNGKSENIAVVPNIDGLVAYWGFNENTGTKASDSSGNNNDGTIIDNEGDQWVPGRFGSALQFDGSDDEIRVTDSASISITGDISIAVWVRKDVRGGTGGIVEKYAGGPRSGYRLTTSGDVVEWFLADGASGSSTATSTTVMAVDTWYFVVGVKDSTNMRIYTNGVEEGTGTTITQSDNNFVLRIGGTAPGVSTFFDGRIDEVAIYNKALSIDEIKQLYSGLVSPGQLAKVKPLTPLQKGTHTLRLCTSTICSTAILTIL